MRLRLENERLQSEVEQLRKLVGGGISDLEGASAVVDFDDPLRIQALEIELQHAKEALAGKKMFFPCIIYAYISITYTVSIVIIKLDVDILSILIFRYNIY